MLPGRYGRRCFRDEELNKIGNFICYTLIKTCLSLAEFSFSIVCLRGGGIRKKKVGEWGILSLLSLSSLPRSLSPCAPVNLIQGWNENTIHWENHFNTEENTNTKAWIRPWSCKPLCLPPFAPPPPLCPRSSGLLLLLHLQCCVFSPPSYDGYYNTHTMF